MTIELFAALAAFAFISLITPGPNNLMLLASGMNFGWLRTVPHMLGIGIGFPVMIVLVGLGAMQVFELVPASYTRAEDPLCRLSVLPRLEDRHRRSRAIGRWRRRQHAAELRLGRSFQWINPKPGQWE